MCDLLNVYMSVNRADALEGSHCLQFGLRMRVGRSAPAQYAGQGSCVSNAGCREYRSWESDLFNDSIEQVHEKGFGSLMLGWKMVLFSKYYIQN